MMMTLRSSDLEPMHVLCFLLVFLSPLFFCALIFGCHIVLLLSVGGLSVQSTHTRTKNERLHGAISIFIKSIRSFFFCTISKHHESIVSSTSMYPRPQAQARHSTLPTLFNTNGGSPSHHPSIVCQCGNTTFLLEGRPVPRLSLNGPRLSTIKFTPLPSFSLTLSLSRYKTTY